MIDAPDDARYLIWSNEHRRWWGPGRLGYSAGILGAGLYSRGEALEICRQAIPGATHSPPIAEIPVRQDDVLDFLQGQRMPSCILNGD